MPGKLRRRSQSGSGLAAETPQTSSLPLIEATCATLGVARSFGLAEELAAAGYFELGIVAQWKLVQDRLAERFAEDFDPIGLIHELTGNPESRVRFHGPGICARLLAEHPQRVLEELRLIARDENHMVAEAVQAFGVRPQAELMGPEVVQELLPWTMDRSETVRRTAVEALRPRGVWVKHLTWSVQSPALMLPIIEALRGDHSRYVANAVGNALNDISKKKPELVLEIATRWHEEGDVGPHQTHMIKKALRTMVKDGDERALAFLGFGKLALSVQVSLATPQPVQPNTALVFELEIHNEGGTCAAQLVYEIETPGKNPKRPRQKKYRAGEIEIPGSCYSEFKIRERIFDRKTALLIDGACRARFYLNGREYQQVDFELRRASVS
ncbi:MAG: DNA alkylation repair protein [Planctomycetes bacterium]|nr:DNA alkylation repair protein [Planctomycetota bacterium]